MMNNQNKEMDVESQKKSRRRCRCCLDVFLVASVVLLFVTVAAGGVIVMSLSSGSGLDKDNRDNPESIPPSDDPGHKIQKFAHLEAIPSELNNSTISWEQVFYGDGKSVGSNFLFDEKQHSLKPKNAGTYFMYLNINLTCTSYSCPAGLLTVHLGDKLTCEVKIPKDHLRVSHKCWTVSWMDNKTGILAQMTVPKEGLENWKLERRGSNFGMFLVD